LSVFSSALASGPSSFHGLARAQAKNQTINGKLTVTDVLRAKKNESVYGHFYAHNSAQVWNGLLIHNGGIKTDALDDAGALAAGSATITGNLSAGQISAGAISGSTLTTTGAATIGGALSAAGLISGNGFNAGSGNVTTTGLAASGQITAGSVSSSGALSAGSIATTGALTAGNATLQNLTVGGNVNFAGATVSGLNISSLNGTLAALSLGVATSTASPLNLNENNKTASLGVDSNGNLTFGPALVGGSLGVAGNLTVGGSNGVTATGLTAPTTSNSSTLGALSLNGGTIGLNGPVTATSGLTLSNGGDVTLSSNNTSHASHVTAAGDRDVAGTATVNIPNSTAAGTDIATLAGSGTTVPFTQVYTSMPIVTLTATSLTSPATAGAPKVWVTPNPGGTAGTFTGFTIHYVPTTDVTATGHYSVSYNYIVVGQ
jgi:hypothetical protein